MKSRIILNIIIAYFILLTVVLITQLPRDKIIATEPAAEDLRYEDKLKNAVVIYVDSPIMLLNERQQLINEKDLSIMPRIVNGRTYIPASLLSKAYGANINWNKNSKQTTIRLDNKALIFENGSGVIKVVDNTSEENHDIEDVPIIIEDRVYIPLRLIADLFDKDVFSSDKLIILSSIENIFDPIEEVDTINEIIKEVSKLPMLRSEDKLRELIGESRNILAGGELLNNFLPQDFASVKEEQPEVIPAADTENTRLMKIDNEYIYRIENGILEIIRAVPPEAIESIISLPLPNGFVPADLFVSKDRLAVIGSVAKGKPNSSCYIYDTTTKENTTLIREISADGNYLGAVMTDGILYMTSEASVYDLYADKKFLTPSFTDTYKSIAANRLSYEEIAYFPNMAEKTFLTVLTADISNDGEVFASSVLGGASEILMTKDTLYTASYDAGNPQVSYIYKFGLRNSSIDYVNYCIINGKPINENPMNEINGDLYIVSTNGSLNSIYVYDELMKPQGALENAFEAVSKIKYTDSSIYALTDKGVCYAVEVKKHTIPKLKYSFELNGNLFMPYDAHYAVTAGYDDNGKIRLTALDMNADAPVEMFSETIDKDGVITNIFENHELLFFDADNHIAAFPVSIYEKSEENQKDKFVFQGVYCYGFDTEFNYRGKITHYRDMDYEDETPIEQRNIKHIASVGDYLYTFSDAFDMVCKTEDMTFISQIKKNME